MTELLVPFSIVFALAQGCRDARWRSVLYLGVCLPDAGRALLHLQAGSPASFAYPLHSPAGAAAWCFTLALFFEEEWRMRAFGALLLGAWIHLAIDLVAAPPDSDLGVFWALPFSARPLELGWIPRIQPWALRAGAGVAIGVAALGSRLGRRFAR